MKRLIFRLSSLGDVILSQALLETPFEGETHWVVAKEYESLLLGHPKVARVWSYDRKSTSGIKNWIIFLRRIEKEKYDLVIDAHATLRTRIAKFIIKGGPWNQSPVEWRTISKERIRRIGYIALKRLFPKHLRPHHLSTRAAKLSGGIDLSKPNLLWMIKADAKGLGKKQRIAVAPSSVWPGKEWPTERYCELINQLLLQNPELEIAILGVPSDSAALHLKGALEFRGVPHINWVGSRSLPEVAKLVKSCDLTVGGDTGLLHLSEAVGVPVVTLFGPTRSDFGFGPLDSQSVPVNSPLWCSPCSKDGTLCFRITNRYQCMSAIPTRDVLGAIQKIQSEIQR